MPGPYVHISTMRHAAADLADEPYQPIDKPQWKGEDTFHLGQILQQNPTPYVTIPISLHSTARTSSRGNLVLLQDIKRTSGYSPSRETSRAHLRRQLTHWYNHVKSQPRPSWTPSWLLFPCHPDEG